MSDWHRSAGATANSSVDPLTGSQRVHEPASAHPPAEPERWEARGQVGAGGMGQVAIVYDRRLGRELALKTPVSAADGERLMREALVTARLEHPGIVAVYDAGHGPDGAPWFAMRLVRGSSLQSLLQTSTDRSHARLLRHVLAAAEAIAFAHACGVVHRDLKPANIMIGAFGETQVIDWGLALTPDLPTPDPGRAGTPSAMSPEQARGEALDARADVYALGAILRHVVTGRATFGDSDRATTLAALAKDQIPPLPAVDAPPELVALIARAMAPRPADRYPDAKALADDLARFLDGRRVSAHSYSPMQLMRRLVVAWRVPLTIIALGAILLALAVAFAFERVSEEAERSQQSLALTLVNEAQRALALDLRGPAEILAAAAFERQPIEARGVLMALPAERPQRRSIAPLGCPPNDVVVLPDGRARVVCRATGTLAVSDDGVPRWGASVGADAAVFIDGGHTVLVYRDSAVFDQYRAEDGALLRSEPAWCAAHRIDPGVDARWALGWGGGCAMRVRGEGIDVIPIDLCASMIRGAAVGRDEKWAVLCNDGAIVVGRFAAGDGLGRVPAPQGERFETDLPESPTPPLPSMITFEGPNRLLVGNDQGQLVRIDLAAFVPGPAGQRVLPVGRGLVRDIVVAPDQSHAVVVLDGEAPSVIDLGRWASLGRLPNRRSTLHPRVAFDSQGRFTLAHAEIERWDFRSAIPRNIEFPAGLSALAVSGDGRLLAAGCSSELVVIDVERRAVVATHRWQDDLVKAVALGPNAEVPVLVAAAIGRPAAVTFDPLRSSAPLRADTYLKRLGVLDDGSAMAIDYEQQVLHLTADRPARAFRGIPGADLSVSPDGHRALVLATDHKLHRARDPHRGGDFTPLAIDLAASDVAIEDDGTSWSLSPDGIRGWKVDGAELPPIDMPGADLIALAAAAELIAAGSKDGTVYVWKKGVPTPWAIVRDHDMRADTLVIEPRGRWIASGAWDGKLSFLRRPDDVALTGLDAAERHWGVTLQDLLRVRR